MEIKPQKWDSLVLVSGGIDSAACAHFLQGRGGRVRGLFVDYGQPAAKIERTAAKAVASALDFPLATCEISGTEKYESGEIVGRNAFLVIATLFISQPHTGLIALGIHSGTPYYDCSAAFLNSIKNVISENTNGKVSVVAPFLYWHKQDIFQYCVDSGVPIELTYSCEAGDDPPCGNCLSCRDRSAIGC